MLEKNSLSHSPMNGKQQHSPPLTDRLDDALGEASSGIGVLLSELVRRTLKGGVQKIDDEMQMFALEKVEAEVARKMPQFEEAAVNTAQSAARELVVVQAEKLTSELAEVERRAADRLDVVKKQSDEQVQRLADAEKRTAEQVAEAERRATEGIDGVKRQVESDLADSSQRLERKINETKESTEKSTKEMIEGLTANSKAFVQKVKASLEGNHQQITSLQSAVKTEATERASQLSTLEQSLVQQLSSLQTRCQQMEAQIVELQKPRGVWGFFSRLFQRLRGKRAETNQD